MTGASFLHSYPLDSDFRQDVFTHDAPPTTPPSLLDCHLLVSRFVPFHAGRLARPLDDAVGRLHVVDSWTIRRSRQRSQAARR